MKSSKTITEKQLDFISVQRIRIVMYCDKKGGWHAKIQSLKILLVMSKTMIDVCLFKAKIRLFKFDSKSRMFEFNFQKLKTLEFVRCWKNDVRVCSMFHKMVFDPSLFLLFGNFCFNSSICS